MQFSRKSIAPVTRPPSAKVMSASGICEGDFIKRILCDNRYHVSMSSRKNFSWEPMQHQHVLWKILRDNRCHVSTLSGKTFCKINSSRKTDPHDHVSVESFLLESVPHQHVSVEWKFFTKIDENSILAPRNGKKKGLRKLLVRTGVLQALKQKGKIPKPTKKKKRKEKPKQRREKQEKRKR